jgi:hypothetical protein
MPFASTIEKRIPYILAGITVLAITLYILVSYFYFRTGFPLDDAWIHQTYARSLAQTGRWDYFSGQPSAGGSTSPFWSLLLVPGYLLKINLYVWTFSLGTISLWGTSILAEWTVRRIVTGYHPSIPWVGILFACEWHLVWAAVSGMETILYIFLITLFFVLLMNTPRREIALGLIVGASIWVRPDGITLLIPLFLTVTLTASSYQEWFKNILKNGIGFSLLVAPYLLFNLGLSGSLMPNTFYAKQTEYSTLQLIPFYQRFVEQAIQPLIGVGIIILPVVLLGLYAAILNRDWAVLSSFFWVLIFTGLYAARLPVIYQHGRYEMPVIPIFLLLGCLAGAKLFVEQNPQNPKIIIRSVWALSTGLICAAFFVIGAWTYAKDVAYIESEMVDTAQWVAVNLPSGDLIAAHDIGALGYFGSHKLIDLAGLISPDVIPIMQDQQRLKLFLDKNDASYLVSFPGWYPDLIRGKKEVFSINSKFIQTYGGENMVVYRWQK